MREYCGNCAYGACNEIIDRGVGYIKNGKTQFTHIVFKCPVFGEAVIDMRKDEADVY